MMMMFSCFTFIHPRLRTRSTLLAVADVLCLFHDTMSDGDD